jgi:riboflavin kinase / FMN adenylyltransferase
MMGSFWRSGDRNEPQGHNGAGPAGTALIVAGMDVIHFPEDARPSRWSQPVLALGNFDGVHRGHRKILDRVRRVAGERGATSVVMTFDPHPPRVVRPDKAPPLLMTTPQKLEAIADAGVQGAAIVRFSAELSHWEPETFVRTVLVDWLHVGEVWVGANFLFGRDRSGNFSLLRVLGGRYGFKAEKIDPVRYKDFVVSSTRVRRLVSEGRVDEAGALLGHQYFVDGVVMRGDQRGRTLGFPTANLCSENELLPPHGVYATTARVGAIVLPSVTNVGTRPTVDQSGRTVIETHIFNFERDLYGQSVRIGFAQRLRDERTFESLDALRAQIDADCQRARVLFTHLSL